MGRADECCGQEDRNRGNLLGNFVESCERKLIKHELPRVQWWEETVKPGIRRIVRDFDAREANKLKRHLELLHRQYERAKKRLSEGDESWKAFFLELRDELSRRTMERFEGLKIVGGSSSPIDDEPASLHHVAAANKLASSGLACLKDLEGKAQTDPDKIAIIVETLFKSLRPHKCMFARRHFPRFNPREIERGRSKETPRTVIIDGNLSRG